MKLGIAGYGIVGGALGRWLDRHTSHQLLVYDRPKKRLDDLTPVDALFISVPVPTVDREQDLSIIKEILGLFGTSRQRIFIRSSVLPGTCDRLAKAYNLHIYAMPEFLTERFADRDQDALDIICGTTREGRTEQYSFLTEIFASHMDHFGPKSFTLMSNVEAELAKYMHNGNGTIKVHFNNLIAQLAQRMGADYAKVRQGALMSGHINPTHTLVPGPDGLPGYGGTCFPKDLDALIGLMNEHGIECGSLSLVQAENSKIRRAAG